MHGTFESRANSRRRKPRPSQLSEGHIYLSGDCCPLAPVAAELPFVVSCDNDIPAPSCRQKWRGSGCRGAWRGALTAARCERVRSARHGGRAAVRPAGPAAPPEPEMRRRSPAGRPICSARVRDAARPAHEHVGIKRGRRGWAVNTLITLRWPNEHYRRYTGNVETDPKRLAWLETHMLPWLN